MANFQIYINEPVQHASDRAVLRKVVELVSKHKLPAAIFANVNIHGRQIDLIVGLEGFSLVIEAKASSNPLQGGVNGDWSVRTASRGWKPTRNYYQQTLNASHAVKDAMGLFAGAEVKYPFAALVFVPEIACGSAVCPSDFKVSVINLNDIEAILGRKTAGHWPLNRWHRFAAHLNLKKVETFEAAIDPCLAEAEDLISSYTAAFQQTYGPLGKELVAYSCIGGDGPISSDAIIAQGAAGADLLLLGPSGCGKTLAAYSIAAGSIQHGRVPMFIRAQEFEGNLRDIVQRETTLLDAPSGKALINACQRLNRPLIFIVDGYNECIERDRDKLVRSVAAVARRYEAALIMTTQMPPARADLLDIQEIRVLAPDADVKLEIARKAGGPSIEPSIQSLLDSVGSGLEARLLGEAGRELPADASRYAIFDGYVRRKLGSTAHEGIRALADIAGLLADRVSFSLSVRDLERFADHQGISPDLLQQLQQVQLLTIRADRVAFAHELFLNAFAAEAVIRRAGGGAREVVLALESPHHAEHRNLIVGAIDDVSLLISVLSEISEVILLEACLAGQCGPVARAWGEARCADVLIKLRVEADQAAFEIDDKGMWGVRSTEGSLLPWTRQEKAILAVLGLRIAAGLHIDQLLEVVSAMDYCLNGEYDRLRGDAKNRKVAILSGIFAECYVFRRDLGISIVFDALRNGRFAHNISSDIGTAALERLGRPNLSPGQIYLLLALYRRARREPPSIAPLLPALLDQYWCFAPYHLKLDLLWAAQWCARASDPLRLPVIEALQNLPPTDNIMLSSSIVDALKCLGAFQDEEFEHTNGVRAEIQMVLANRENPDMQALACQRRSEFPLKPAV